MHNLSTRVSNMAVYDCLPAVPVKQCQESESVKLQADPQVGQEPQAIVLPGFPCSCGGCGVLLARWCILKFWTQISVLLLQQLWVHRQQTVQTDLREGELSHSKSEVKSGQVKSMKSEFCTMNQSKVSYRLDFI